MLLYILLGIQIIIMLLIVAELMNTRREISEVKEFLKKTMNTK
jgi:hypothetical protein